MLRINRLKIIIKTIEGEFGFDNTFDKKINFIASKGNTRGKSSCIEAIYYCLGLEELIGGKGEKALKPVFRDRLEYQNKEIFVLESEFYLEIINENKEIRTIYRTVKKEGYNSDLVKVYFGNITESLQEAVRYEDMYVHSQGAATNPKGFHTFLEKFIGLNLPIVPTYDDNERKLYLQVLFSGIFIEQKKGWADLFACLPTYMKIREPKKRVIEYLIGLESLDVEKLKQRCKDRENNIKKDWEELYIKINVILEKYKCRVSTLKSKPEIINEEEINNIKIYKNISDGESIEIDKYIESLELKMDELESKKETVGDNVGDLEKLLSNKQEALINDENSMISQKKKLIYEQSTVKSLEENLNKIDDDLISNKDVRKLKKMGSTQDLMLNRNICPTCNQAIKDILLPQNNEFNIMGIDENIRHLEAQKNMLEFAISTHKYNIKQIEENVNKLHKNILTDRRILRSVKNDLYTIDNNISETVIREKVLIQNEIEELTEEISNVKNLSKEFISLSNDWKNLINDKAKLPKDKFTEKDKIKIKNLRNSYIKNLELYEYSSTINIRKIEISEDKLIPLINGFDMKFDSSASDNIRAIWAFTFALMQASFENHGNHPQILIFDELAQQSMVKKELYNFFKSLLDFKREFQTIIGITIDSDEVMNSIKKLNKDEYKLIMFEDRVITHM
ncbi:hypothetical protein EXM69_16130 [Clostridium botulinum]|uniref:Rad50/SbcC-type AAA domain-containing protein n=1 Tax=Clostridium botulinum TaxID=1491 RepID=A0A846I781_CLOBO|nr:hypothetical protein [Clostridium botulinum]